MEQLQHKIITFLTRNAHLDVEAPDIAFHLKMDEKEVQATLDALLEKGVVSVQKNQYDRTYWYYVPQRSSMPFETMSAKIPQEISEFIEEQDDNKKDNRFAILTLAVSIISLLLTIACGIGLFIMVNTGLVPYDMNSEIVFQRKSSQLLLNLQRLALEELKVS